MRFEVPQFIEIEDKIIGPLTWRQFVYIAGGAGLIVILYLSTPFIFFIFLGLPIGALSGALAFHRVNNRPFSIFLESLASYARKAKLYLWRRDLTQSVIDTSRKFPQAPQSPSATPQSIHSLSRKLDLHIQ